MRLHKKHPLVILHNAVQLIDDGVDHGLRAPKALPKEWVVEKPIPCIKPGLDRPLKWAVASVIIQEPFQSSRLFAVIAGVHYFLRSWRSIRATTTVAVTS